MSTSLPFPKPSKRLSVYEALSDGNVHILSEIDAIGGRSVIESVQRYGEKTGEWNIIIKGKSIQMLMEDMPTTGDLEEEEEAIVELSDEELEARIKDLFDSLDYLGNGVVSGTVRSLIVSGQPGVGKTYCLEAKLATTYKKNEHKYTHVRGSVSASGLYRLLYEHRDDGQVLMLDDTDAIYNDEKALGLLKAVLDTTGSRTVSWLSTMKFEDSDGEAIPPSFEFNGTVIFITNVDLAKIIRSGNKLAPHVKALMTRSIYLNLNLSTREIMLRIRSLSDKILSDLDGKGRKIVMTYVEENYNNLWELSLRSVAQIRDLYVTAGKDEKIFNMLAKNTVSAAKK